VDDNNKWGNGAVSDKIKSTLYIDKSKRDTIRQSGLSLEEYCNRLFELQESFNISNWKDGVFKINHFRVGLFRAETINLIINHIDEKPQRELGKKIGENFRLIIENRILKIPLDADMGKTILERQNSFTGWGFYTLEEHIIIVTTPIFTKPYFLQGYLEGLLNLKLTVLESVPDRFVYKMVP
jgi:hypothetical protein